MDYRFVIDNIEKLQGILAEQAKKRGINILQANIHQKMVLIDDFFNEIKQPTNESRGG
jgi:hypothetical protein